MRVMVVAIFVLAVLPANAGAQVFPIAQDLSVGGEIVATHSPTEKTVRFTATNHGPGAVASHVHISLQVSIEETIVSAPGCTLQEAMPGYAITGRCELGTGLAEGATRSIDARVRLIGIDYDQDYVLGSVQAAPAPGANPQGDANGANNSARVDLEVVPPPPAMRVTVTVPGFAQHGKPVRHYYLLENTGGYDLTNVVVTDDRCPNPQIASGTPVVRHAGGLLTLVCDHTAPSHRKGDLRYRTNVTVTALAGGQTLTHTQAFTTYFLHPERACGSFRTRRKGKLTRWKATTTRADVPCKRVREQLAACRREHRAPKGFRCRTFKTLILMRSKTPGDPAVMRAIKL
jgi:hypothetical protein